MKKTNIKDGRSETRLFVALTDEERLKVKENKEHLKSTYKLSLSKVLRIVILEHIYKKEFLEYIGVIGKNN